MTDSITPRAAAIAAGEPYYFTGKPCRNGHVDKRFTQSGTCTRCLSEANSKRPSMLAFKPQAAPDATTGAVHTMRAECVGEVYAIVSTKHIGLACEFVQALAAARWPEVPWELLAPNPGRPRDNNLASCGMVRLVFRVHPDDIEVVRKWRAPVPHAPARPASPFEAELAQLARLQPGAVLPEPERRK